MCKEKHVRALHVSLERRLKLLNDAAAGFAS